MDRNRPLPDARATFGTARFFPDEVVVQSIAKSTLARRGFALPMTTPAWRANSQPPLADRYAAGNQSTQPNALAPRRLGWQPRVIAAAHYFAWHWPAPDRGCCGLGSHRF